MALPRHEVNRDAPLASSIALGGVAYPLQGTARAQDTLRVTRQVCQYWMIDSHVMDNIDVMPKFSHPVTRIYRRLRDHWHRLHLRRRFSGIKIMTELVPA